LLPTSISANTGKALLLTNSSPWVNGTTSSARDCKITVLCLTGLAVACFFHGLLDTTAPG
jgi:hypothetical protein